MTLEFWCACGRGGEHPVTHETANEVVTTCPACGYDTHHEVIDQ